MTPASSIPPARLSKTARAAGYHIRSLAETGVFRIKANFGDHLASRRPDSQVTEGAIRARH
jgi:hypothetical protein